MSGRKRKSEESSLSSTTSDTTLKVVKQRLSKKRRTKLRKQENIHDADLVKAKLHRQQAKALAKGLVKPSGRELPQGEQSTRVSGRTPPVFKIPKIPQENPKPIEEELVVEEIEENEVVENEIVDEEGNESGSESDKAPDIIYDAEGNVVKPLLDPVDSEDDKDEGTFSFEIPKKFHKFLPILTKMAQASEALEGSERGREDHELSDDDDDSIPPSQVVNEARPSPPSSPLTGGENSEVSNGIVVTELSESQKILQQKNMDFASIKPGKTATRIQSQLDKLLESKMLAPRLTPSVALAINEFFVNSKYADELSELSKKYPQVENLERQVPPTLDPMLDTPGQGAGLSPYHIANDTALKNIQKGLMSVISILAEGHTLALSRGEEDPQLDDLGVKMEEAMKMLALSSSGITIHRRQSLKNLLDNKYSKVMVNHSKITDFKFLFGGDLADKKKDTDAARGFVKAVFRHPPGQNAQARGQTRGAPQRGRGYPPNNQYNRGRNDYRGQTSNRGYYDSHNNRGQYNQSPNRSWNNDNQSNYRGGGRGSNRGGHNQNNNNKGRGQQKS